MIRSIAVRKVAPLLVDSIHDDPLYPARREIKLLLSTLLLPAPRAAFIDSSHRPPVELEAAKRRLMLGSHRDAIERLGRVDSNTTHKVSSPRALNLISAVGDHPPVPLKETMRGVSR